MGGHGRRTLEGGGAPAHQMLRDRVASRGEAGAEDLRQGYACHAPGTAGRECVRGEEEERWSEGPGWIVEAGRSFPGDERRGVRKPSQAF